jgi:flagellar motor protein MotB
MRKLIVSIHSTANDIVTGPPADTNFMVWAQAGIEDSLETFLNEQRAAAAADAETLKAQERSQMEQQQAESERIAREQAQAEAERANAAARQEAEIARAARDTANTQPDVGRNRAQVDGRMLRLQVLRELAPVLDTRDSPRGLLVTIPDSLFRTPVTPFFRSASGTS